MTCRSAAHCPPSTVLLPCRVCGWCGDLISPGTVDKAPTFENQDRLSHGICQDCHTILLEESGE